VVHVSKFNDSHQSGLSKQGQQFKKNKHSRPNKNRYLLIADMVSVFIVLLQLTARWKPI